MGKVQLRAGGGRVTVEGLTPDQILAGHTVTVFAGSKKIESVVGTGGEKGLLFSGAQAINGNSLLYSNSNAINGTTTIPQGYTKLSVYYWNMQEANVTASISQNGKTLWSASGILNMEHAVVDVVPGVVNLSTTAGRTFRFFYNPIAFN